MHTGHIIAGAAVLLAFASAASAQQELPPSVASHSTIARGSHDDSQVIGTITFVGLRRISPEALKSQMLCQAGQTLEMARIEQDVRTLARLGWFEAVSVESEEANSQPSNEHARRVNLTFHVPELPFLTGIEYRGSHLLSRQQIEKLLGEKKLTPKLGEPENRVTLHSAAMEIQAALQDLGHPEAQVQINEQVSARATVQVRFEISDGARLLVGSVSFAGNPAFSQKLVRRQMQHLRPGSLFADWRNKDVYTAEAFEEDRERLLTYYQNHGYPDARIGQAQVTKYEANAWRWFPWPRREHHIRLAVHVPVEAGELYSIESVETNDDLSTAAAANGNKSITNQSSFIGQPYSAQAIESLRRAWQAQLNRNTRRKETTPLRDIEVIRIPNAEEHTLRIRLQPSSIPPYTVRVVEFQGLKRFPDRYLRSRVQVKEGQPLDDRALESGLARIARSGYFKPIKRQDIRVQTNDLAHTADIIIHVEEVGQQRASLVGGRGQFGSTVGVAYTLFSIFHGEELLSSRIEGGPESLQLALGLAKEGILGSRGTLALSVFNMFLRPHLTPSVKGPFFRQQTSGVNVDWSYGLTRTDSLAIDYDLSHSKTQYSLALPAGVTGLAFGDLRSETSSHSVGVRWTRDTGSERIQFADSVSGGWLGGSENLVRSRAEYGRIVHDPIFDSQNAWAFRASFAGAGSYSGDMPFASRFFAGDEFVRGLREGDLGPLAFVRTTSTSGSTYYLASPAGANLISAMNAEYRVPLGTGAEASGFLDVGSGWLLPNWLGRTRPTLANVTNGLAHGSTGIEMRWTVPGIGVPVRSYYAFNLLRLHRSLLIYDGSFFRAQNRRFGFGWGLGTLF